jgi:glycosyltransferase involved in cell wall biosynthesis
VALRNGLPIPPSERRPEVAAEPRPPSADRAAGSAPVPHPAKSQLPLVSCIMPTHNRRRFLPQAIRYFMEQDYPQRELIVVDDGSDPIRDLIPDEEHVHYIRLPGRHSIGIKRNLACESAKGKVIMLWDDDDWYARNRISYQVGPLLERRADLTGLDRGLLLSLPTGLFWECTPSLHERMFVQQVIGGTLTFWKSLWQAGAQFPDTSLAEDALFLQSLVQQGARLERLPNQDMFIYVRHDANSWQFTPGNFLDSAGWRRVTTPAFIPRQDLDFYGVSCPASAS